MSKIDHQLKIETLVIARRTGTGPDNRLPGRAHLSNHILSV